MGFWMQTNIIKNPVDKYISSLFTYTVILSQKRLMHLVSHHQYCTASLISLPVYVLWLVLLCLCVLCCHLQEIVVIKKLTPKVGLAPRYNISDILSMGLIYLFESIFTRNLLANRTLAGMELMINYRCRSCRLLVR